MAEHAKLYPEYAFERNAGYGTAAPHQRHPGGGYMPDPSQDLRNKILGRKGETLTVSYLKKRGYRILKRNFRTPFGEADILAKQGDTYCLVEVKTRISDAFWAALRGGERQKAGALPQDGALSLRAAGGGSSLPLRRFPPSPKRASNTSKARLFEGACINITPGGKG